MANVPTRWTTIIKVEQAPDTLQRGKRRKLHRSFCMSHWLANFLLAADFLDVIAKGIFDKKTSFSWETYTFRTSLHTGPQ